MLGATGIMMAALLVAQPLFAAYYEENIFSKAFALAAVITIGIAVYAAAVLALKAYELAALKALLKRR
jgi:hypothetical protein